MGGVALFPGLLHLQFFDCFIACKNWSNFSKILSVGYCRGSTGGMTLIPNFLPALLVMGKQALYSLDL